MPKILLAEKSHTARIFLDQCPDDYGDDWIVICAHPISIRKFEYPQALTYKQLPFYGLPIYKELQGEVNAFKWDRKVLTPICGDIQQLLPLIRGCEALYCATDQDYSGFFSVTMWIAAAEAFEKLPYRLETLDLTKGAVSRAWHNAEQFNYDESPEWSYADRKYYFDFNFNCNSMVIFGDLLRDCGVNTKDWILSKHQLLVLHILRNEGEFKSIGDLVCYMSQYKGTGKYDSEFIGIGSLISRHDIVAQMIERGLISAVAGEEGPISLSDVGNVFMSKLHKKVSDPDLPFRLHAWCNEPNTIHNDREVKEKIFRYIRTIFGKQLGFNRQHRQG